MNQTKLKREGERRRGTSVFAAVLVHTGFENSVVDNFTGGLRTGLGGRTKLRSALNREVAKSGKRDAERRVPAFLERGSEREDDSYYQEGGPRY